MRALPPMMAPAGPAKVSCEVKAWEKVSVAAGQFDRTGSSAWKMAAMLILTGESNQPRWYAPAVGMVVKAVSDKSKWDHQLARTGLTERSCQ